MFNKNCKDGYLTPLDGIRRKTLVHGESTLMTEFKLRKGSSIPLHSHPQEQWGVMLQGNGVRLQDGIEHEVSEGDFWQTPSNVVHSFCAGPDGALVLDIFSPPRDEYRQAGAGLAANLEG